MRHAKAIRQLGTLVVGLGIGAAVAATPGIASADSTAVDAAAFDPSALIVDPAPAASGLDLAISIDGIPLLQEGSATAYSGTGDFAIAYGDDATASAGATSNPGSLDYAFADGTNAGAYAGVGNDDSAIAIGSGSSASVGSGNGDIGFADGTGTSVTAGGEPNLGTVDTVEVAGNDMYASAVGSDDNAAAVAALDGVSAASTGDVATVIGNSSDAYAGVGDYDFAGALSDALTSAATNGNFLFDLMPSL
jgi:hypothetical protein